MKIALQIQGASKSVWGRHSVFWGRPYALWGRHSVFWGHSLWLWISCPQARPMLALLPGRTISTALWDHAGRLKLDVWGRYSSYSEAQACRFWGRRSRKRRRYNNVL